MKLARVSLSPATPTSPTHSNCAGRGRGWGNPHRRRRRRLLPLTQPLPARREGIRAAFYRGVHEEARRHPTSWPRLQHDGAGGERRGRRTIRRRLQPSSRAGPMPPGWRGPRRRGCRHGPSITRRFHRARPSTRRCTRRSTRPEWTSSRWPASCASSRRASCRDGRGASSTSTPRCCPCSRVSIRHQQALDAGVKISGCTVHFVTEIADSGPIVAQAAVPVLDCDTPETLAARILLAEHKLYPHALALVASGRATIEDGRVITRGVSRSGRRAVLAATGVVG